MMNDLPDQVARKLYLFYVRPTLEYASVVWHGSINEEEAIALERPQAGVARPILKASWKTPKTVLLRSLQWSSLRWRREITSMTLFHDFLCTRPPHLAQSICTFSRSKRRPRRLVSPLAITTRYKNSLFWSFYHDMEHPPNSVATNPKQVCF